MYNSTNDEVWKDVEGYEGIYQVSNFGRIKSLDRIVPRIDGSVKKVKGKILKTRVSKGYVLINLNKDGICKTVSLSRLIATTFIPNEENKPEVNHIDEDKTNNSISNLEWCTSLENANHGTRNERIGEWVRKRNKLPDSPYLKMHN